MKASEFITEANIIDKLKKVFKGKPQTTRQSKKGNISPNAFGSMVGQLSGRNVTPSSTGGKISTIPGRTVHTSRKQQSTLPPTVSPSPTSDYKDIKADMDRKYYERRIVKGMLEDIKDLTDPTMLSGLKAVIDEKLKTIGK